jgi:hypothetical protein
MSDNPHHPYVLEIQPGPGPGTFQWALRKSGKLLERSDRAFDSEQKARKDGEKAVERQFSDAR